MPYAADQESQRQIYISSNFSFPAAAKRNIDIVLQPLAERNMPSVPEILNGYRQIRMSEIVRQLNAEQIRHTL